MASYVYRESDGGKKKRVNLVKKTSIRNLKKSRSEIEKRKKKIQSKKIGKEKLWIWPGIEPIYKSLGCWATKPKNHRLSSRPWASSETLPADWTREYRRLSCHWLVVGASCCDCPTSASLPFIKKKLGKWQIFCPLYFFPFVPSVR